MARLLFFPAGAIPGKPRRRRWRSAVKAAPGASGSHRLSNPVRFRDSGKIVQVNTFCLRPAAEPRKLDPQPKPVPTMNDTILETTPTAAPAAAAAERTPDYAIYKPNSRGTGGVVRFGLNRTKGCVFVDAASQSGEKQFDWENKITMKWGLADLGMVLATLQGRQPQAKLFHQSEKANSAFELSPREDPERAPFLLSISRQESADRSVRKVTIPLTHGEAAVLETALRAAVTRVLRW